MEEKLKHFYLYLKNISKQIFVYITRILFKRKDS